jgi:F-type H+-transporting ATPase subunit b
VQIDYFTMVAQIINFLILVFLLRHFLYRPVIKIMDEREKKIASQIKDAEQKRKEAEAEAESFRKMKKELENKHNEMLTKVTEEVQMFKNDLIEKARAEVEVSISDWHESFERQKTSILANIRLHAAKEVYTISRHALSDLANENLEDHIISIFIQRIQELGDDEKNTFKNFYKLSGQIVTVRSTFEIPKDVKQKILEIIQKQTGFEIKIKFEIENELISGIEIRTPGMRIGWNIASYLDMMEADLSRVLMERSSGENLKEEET